jgi:hypothetical protein
MRYLPLAFVLLFAGCGDEDEGSSGRVLLRGTSSPSDPGAIPPPGPGPNPFDDAALTTYRITLAAEDWDAMVANPRDDSFWRLCTVEWQGERYPDCGIQPAGNRSRIPGNPKPSFRIKFDQFVLNREFHRFSSLKFDSMYHDSSMMRCRLEYPVYQQRRVPSPQYVHARIEVNGAYKGVYGIEERVKKEFVRKRFGLPVNQLYSWTASGTMHDLLWAGPDPVTNYVPRMWAPEIPELPPDAEGVREICYRLNMDVVRLPEIFDVESFLNFIAVETLLGEGDNYVAGTDGLRTANIRLYKSPLTGKYLILPWDCDQGFFRPQTGITEPFQNRLLTKILVLENAQNLERYKQILRELIEGPYATPLMHARVDYIFNQIKDAVLEDPVKPYSYSSFEGAVRSIKSYITRRNDGFLQQLR